MAPSVIVSRAPPPFSNHGVSQQTELLLPHKLRKAEGNLTKNISQDLKASSLAGVD